MSPYSASDFCLTDDPYEINYKKTDLIQIYYKEGLHETFRCTESELVDRTFPNKCGIYIENGIMLKYNDQDYRYIFSKQMYNILIIAPNPAIFGAKAKKLVTEVGEPWYTSGDHI